MLELASKALISLGFGQYISVTAGKVISQWAGEILTARLTEVSPTTDNYCL